jgi:hypothetical protein
MTLSREQCAAANVCVFHPDRPAVWNPGNGEASYCAECKRRWVDMEQVKNEIDLRKVK